MLIKKSLKNLMLIFLVIIYSCERDQPVFGENGMVVSTSSQASQVGIDIMKAGGNAIDAAAAVGFALAVRPITLLSAAIKAMQDVLVLLKNEEDTVPKLLPSFAELKTVVGFDQYFEEDAKYAV